ncbi:MAG: hypothetical protein ACK5KO_11190, partial [Arachnia sp.]
MSVQRVLFTSGTHFLSAYCVVAFLRAELPVRVMVPSLPRGSDVKEMVAAAAADPESGLGLVLADIDEPGWETAMADCRAVVHIERELVSVSGIRSSGLPDTEQVVAAAERAGVPQTVVLRRLDAEAWEPPATTNTDLTVINHALPLGPPLTPEHLDAINPLTRIMSGKPGYLLPRRYRFVDVRDLAGQAVMVVAPDAGDAFPAQEYFDPELAMLGIAAPAPGVEDVSVSNVAEPQDGQLRLPGWSLTERQLARRLDERMRRVTRGVPWFVAPRWSVALRIRFAGWVGRVSGLAPLGG